MKGGVTINCHHLQLFRNIKAKFSAILVAATDSCPYKDQFFTNDDVPYDPANDSNINDDQGNQNVVAEENPAYSTHFNSVQLFDVLINDVFHNEYTLAKIFLDTGCVRSVAGRKWFKAFIMTLSEETRKKIMKYISHARFRFGGTDIKHSLGLYTVPCSINGKNILLQIDVIDCNIPCLISKFALKKAGGIINLEEDTVRLFGQVVKMENAPSGHYTLPVHDIVKDDNTDVQVFMTDMVNPVYNEEQLVKIHKALGHPGRKALEQTLDAANVKIPNLDFILNKLYNSCLVCLKNKPTPVKPKVSLPMAQDFNQTVCLDLKIWPSKNVIILYIIDAYTRFQQAHIIPDKKAETIVKALVDNWILKLYGAPSNYLTDCGGEFYNWHFKEMCQQFGINMLVSSAESPWQNGLCERNHASTDRIVTKMMEDDKTLNIHSALAAATFAKNCLVNVNGFSPIQLVTGKMPRLPNVHDNMLPALEARSSSKLISDRINAILHARKVFMEIENSQRLNRALKTKMIPTIEHYELGDKVFYKKEGTDALWDGPAQVIGVTKNQKTIYLSHGRFTYSTSQSRLCKIPEDILKRIMPPNQIPVDPDSDDDDSETESGQNNPREVAAQAAPVVQAAPAAQAALAAQAAHDQVPPQPQPPVVPGPLAQVEAGRADTDQGPVTPARTRTPQPSRSPSAEFSFISPTINQIDQTDNDQFPGGSQSDESADTMPRKKTNPKKRGIKPPYPKRNQEIFFRIRNTTEYSKIHPTLVERYGKKWVKVIIMCRVFQNSQGCGPYFNFTESEDPNFKDGVHLDQTDWSYVNSMPMPRTLADSVHNYMVEDDPEPLDSYVVHVPRDQWHTPEVQEAMQKELKNFAEFQVYDLVKEEGQPYITCGWVIVRKEKEGVEIVKARQILHGNQEPYAVRSDSPTVKKINLRLMLAICVQNGWTMCSSDVQAAFLQSVELDREVYVKPVKEANHQGLLWKLKKPMYGLGDSGRFWYLTITQFLEEKGCISLITDPAFYFYIKDGQLHGMAALHVDDIQHCGTPEFDRDVIEPMHQKFKFGSVQKKEFKCLGWDMVQSIERGFLTIDQIDYVKNKIALMDIQIAGRDGEEMLNPPEISKMRGGIGQARWLIDNTHPECAGELLHLAMSVNRAQVKDVKLFNKMVNHVKNHPLKIKFQKLPGAIGTSQCLQMRPKTLSRMESLQEWDTSSC